MKFKNLLKLPFTVIADIATLGNVGDYNGSYTSQIISQDKREQNEEKELKIMLKFLTMRGRVE